ncbi:DUF1036 domain-containing protein [Leisingera aquaemixtae]|uniref:DUF1036 domain-containing protein n=1 Tax=Leisingera aquaemixtae TaxID=1396826 RepID=A0ABY5WMB6_9RHOB|nr:DUF1036 domain-containing protein [Leisingera aquaemixtae]UWQ42623.1 DUF1036 domain-containing protein [Leisingera aquaemixtae]
MAFFLWLPALLLAALSEPAAASAGTSICNDTGALHQLAVTARTDGSWITQGWQALAPGDCTNPLPEGYQGRFFYFRAESPGYQFRDDSIRFCTKAGPFRAGGSGDCAARGYREQAFARARISTDSQKIPLSSRSQAAAAAPDTDAAGGTPYTAAVVLQGCSPEQEGAPAACRFVGGGMEIRATAGKQAAVPAFAFLMTLQQGAPLAVEGELISSFGSHGDLDLHSAALRQPNRHDRLLRQMQGRWVSAADPGDSFTLSGAVRQVSYRGSAMPPEFVSVLDTCHGAGTAGDFLLARDSERGTGLCYRIQSLGSDELTLIYLPRGTRLVYRRLPEG